MARPKKKPADRRGRDLTIPVTEAERTCIKQGAAVVGMDMATWARPILLESATRLLKHR